MSRSIGVSIASTGSYSTRAGASRDLCLGLLLDATLLLYTCCNSVPKPSRAPWVKKFSCSRDVIWPSTTSGRNLRATLSSLWGGGFASWPRISSLVSSVAVSNCMAAPRRRCLFLPADGPATVRSKLGVERSIGVAPPSLCGTLGGMCVSGKAPSPTPPSKGKGVTCSSPSGSSRGISCIMSFPPSNRSMSSSARVVSRKSSWSSSPSVSLRNTSVSAYRSSPNLSLASPTAKGSSSGAASSSVMDSRRALAKLVGVPGSSLLRVGLSAGTLRSMDCRSPAVSGSVMASTRACVPSAACSAGAGL
mmetsp:Transcript_3871/g.13732  ORF Transcript_3871/g.13732 Transcript_3871/m.13732 type:complete len:305 (+) Transcript_3871:1520-2434(+)